MDFTREPIIETVITPREGYRLVVRNSKVMGQEEHFVDSIEVVSFGGACFFRSIERPKPFLVPIGDYEVMEVRESRIVLKSPHMQEGSIKIGAQRESSKEAHREHQRELQRQARSQEAVDESKIAPEARPQANQAGPQAPAQENNGRVDGRQQDKRRERRKPFRRRRGQYREEGRDETAPNSPYEEMSQQESNVPSMEETMLPEEVAVGSRASHMSSEAVAPTLRSVLPPPTTLIRDDLQRLRDNEMYRGAFFLRDEKDEDEPDEK